MRKMLVNLLGIAVAASFSGCATVYRVSESPDVDNTRPQHGLPTMRDPAVRVDVVSSGEQAGSLAAAVKLVVENGLASRGFTVVAKGRPDSVVALDLACKSKDKLADWRLYEGKSDVRITEASSGKLVASKSFIASGERSLDLEKAMKGVKEGLSRQTLAWLEKVLPARKVALPPPPASPAVSNITIAPADMSEDPYSVLAVQRRFMDSVASYPGVVDCRLVSEMPSKHAYVFRVAYDPARFPGGLLNTIVLESPDLGDNVRLEIVR